MSAARQQELQRPRKYKVWTEESKEQRVTAVRRRGAVAEEISAAAVSQERLLLCLEGEVTLL